jgi:Uri superfamily endonuclease
MKHAVEMSSGAMIYILSFIMIGSAIQKLIGRIHRHTDSIVIA